MGLHVIDEAKRCLNCKKPRCQEGCPIHTPIPVMIQMLLQGDDAGGGRNGVCQQIRCLSSVLWSVTTKNSVKGIV